jgi:hypothetical protein
VTGAVIGVLILLVLALATLLAVVAARSRAGEREPGRPDEVSDEVVTGLLAELRSARAEAQRWKDTAERLQRRLEDDR